MLPQACEVVTYSKDTMLHYSSRDFIFGKTVKKLTFLPIYFVGQGIVSHLFKATLIHPDICWFQMEEKLALFLLFEANTYDTLKIK